MNNIINKSWVLMLVFILFFVQLLCFLVIDRLDWQSVSRVHGFLLASQVVLMLLFAIAVKQKIAVIVILVLAVLLSPAYSPDTYSNVRNTTVDQYLDLNSGDDRYKLLHKEADDDFILVKKNSAGVWCYGPYNLSQNDCQKLALKLFTETHNQPAR